MRFPEEQLTTYLRVFIPDGRIADVLDQVAQAAIEADVQDEIELYALTHWLMDTDERRTPEVEAVVLVEEVGLAPADVAIILDLQVEEVDAAVRAAWAEVTGVPEETAPLEPEPAAAEPEPEPEPAEDPGPVVESDPGPVVESDPGPVVEPDPGPEVEATKPARLAPVVPSRPSEARPGGAGRRVVVGLSVLSLIVLAGVVFSSDGSDRLLAQGQNPLLWFGMVVVLLGVGAGILRATAEPSPPGEAGEDAEVSAADPSDGPAAPSA